MARGDDLRRIAGIGEAIAKKTVELLSTGRLEFLEGLKSSVPEVVLVLLQAPGIGPRTAARLVEGLGVTTLEALDAALEAGVVAQFPGVGEQSAGALRRAVDSYRARRRPSAETGS